MKKIGFIIIIFLVMSILSIAQNSTTKKGTFKILKTIAEKELILVDQIIEEEKKIIDYSKASRFPGGEDSLTKYIANYRATYSLKSIYRKTRKDFEVRLIHKYNKLYIPIIFQVDTNGIISNFKTEVVGLQPYVNYCAKLVAGMPAWELALNSEGKKIPSTVNLSINLDKEIIAGDYFNSKENK